MAGGDEVNPRRVHVKMATGNWTVSGFEEMNVMRWVFLFFIAVFLTGCAAPKYTTDDGRRVNETLLGHIKTFGAGERALRPAIVRSAALQDATCDTQWDLPFSVASSDGWTEDDRVAWVRGLGVDERLTVVAIGMDSGVQIGDKVQDIDGYNNQSSEKMLLELADRRDAGKPFNVKFANGKTIKVKPFKVCRGYTRWAPPNSPQSQDYHWLMSVHPLEVGGAGLTDDEALWVVLWSQGVSEEGGARMKTYHYGSKVIGTLYNLFTIASGIKGAALAADAAMTAAKSAAGSAATEILKQQLIDQASAAAASRMRDEVMGVAKKMTQQQVMGAMQAAAANRGSLSGVAWVASTAFEQADAWAYTGLERLNADPMASFTLHQKLIEMAAVHNSMVFDSDRLTALNKLAVQRGREADVLAILQGIKPDDLQLAMADMPVASAPEGFSYEDPAQGALDTQPFARGLVDGMLNMPVASKP